MRRFMEVVVSVVLSGVIFCLCATGAIARVILSDCPRIETYNGVDFGWPSWGGYWVRHSNQWVEFTFHDIDTNYAGGANVFVELNLGVTNAANGEKGLDGLVDIVVNPGSSTPISFTDVLLDNVDPQNIVYLMGAPIGAYETYGEVAVPKGAVVDSCLVVKILRHTDALGGWPDAPIGWSVPIDTTVTPPAVPPGVYENDDGHAVHINVYTTDGSGEVALPGEAMVTCDPETKVHETVQFRSDHQTICQNYPNPFGSSVTIRYNLRFPCDVTLRIYDLTGKLVRALVNSFQTAGRHATHWDGKDEWRRALGSGVYIYELNAGDSSQRGKMVMIR